MSHHFLIHPFGCLRVLVCIFVLSLTVSVCAPPLAWSQDAPADDVTEQDAAPQDAPPEQAPEDAAPAEPEPAEAEPEEAPEDATPAEAAPEDAVPEENKPWTLSQPCENTQHPYEADLCQQWRTAEIGLVGMLSVLAGLRESPRLVLFRDSVFRRGFRRRCVLGRFLRLGLGRLRFRRCGVLWRLLRWRVLRCGVLLGDVVGRRVLAPSERRPTTSPSRTPHRRTRHRS